MKTALIAAALIATSSTAFAAPEDAVSESRLKSDVDALVGFGTRHTLSSQTDPKRGIGAARTWAKGQFEAASKACGGCLAIVEPETMVSGTRIPTPVRLVDVVAIQKGTERPDEVVIVQGHIDSRVADVMNATADAPGANDDGSGTALVLEAARVLSQHKYPVTIVYAVLSGEEQGLYGGKLLADYAAQQGWHVKAVLNNDIVGNSRGSDGLVDDTHVRVFSEGERADADDKMRAAMRRDGGENDSPSRNLSRFIAGLAPADGKGFSVRQIWRTDRMGRGGDQIPFEQQGVPAVRFSVAVENYDHQHHDLRTDGGVVYGDTAQFMDFAYLSKVTQLNIRALAALASAPMPPSAVAQAAVQTFTDVSWAPVAGAVRYNVWQRRTDQPGWGGKPVRTVDGTHVRLEGVRGDDWFFGVSAVAVDGTESPVASAVPGGGFDKTVAPPKG